jgi:hypothetical protein
VQNRCNARATLLWSLLGGAGVRGSYRENVIPLHRASETLLQRCAYRIAFC